MELNPYTVTQTVIDEYQWKGSEHGFDCTRSITLDLTDTNFAAVTVDDPVQTFRHYIKAGTALYETSTPGVYKVATGGSQAASGHLAANVPFKTGAVKAGGALLWHGVVIAAKVPGTFVTANHVPANILYV